jgi:hypothetical protein
VLIAERMVAQSPPAARLSVKLTSCIKRCGFTALARACKLVLSGFGLSIFDALLNRISVVS